MGNIRSIRRAVAAHPEPARHASRLARARILMSKEAR